jgi:hypothetical protein
MDATYTIKPSSLTQTMVAPVETRIVNEGTLLVDFGKAAFGTLQVNLPSAGERGSIVVHLGEKLGPDGRIERSPEGTVRYLRIKQTLDPAQTICRIVIPTDERNTGPAAIKMPPHIGEVTPFRYAEIEHGASLDPAAIRQVFVHYPFNDQASSFQSSNSVLDDVWDLCKHTIKATTFCGVYVDGDRERIPYEGDAYINQLGHYCVDREYALARYTHEYLIQHPTWPTEWQFHSVFMAWEDYMYTGETQSLETFYDDLCVKTLIGLARPDGLVSTESELCTREFEQHLHFHNPSYIFGHGLRDLVDWPPGSFNRGGQGERDDHDMRPVNTVINAFHCQALVLMSRIAEVLCRLDDCRRFADAAARVKAALNRLLFDAERGVYLDGEGSAHASLHSNMFMLAFGLVPRERIPSVVSFVKSRGMACSVYAAQFLLEALYLNDEDDYALDLLTATHDRSWWNMIRIGSTMTLEAWDWKYKNNLDWNHAWGAVPANIIPRFLMGLRPLEPGLAKILVQPRPGNLASAQIKFPTCLGPVLARFENRPGESFVLEVSIPEGMTARIDLPRLNQGKPEVLVDGESRRAMASGPFLSLDVIESGEHCLKVTRSA